MVEEGRIMAGTSPAGLLDIWWLLYQVFGNYWLILLGTSAMFWIIMMFSRTMSDTAKIWVLIFYLSSMLIASHPIFTVLAALLAFLYVIQGYMAWRRKASS